jgi:hypothetical protein
MTSEKPIALALTFLVVTSGCQHAQPSAESTAIGSNEDMERFLETLIPRGTPIVEAERRMRSQGFDCTHMQKETYYSSDGVPHPGQDVLYCDRTDCGQSFSLVSRRWQIEIVDREHEVAEIAVFSDLLGL